MMHARKRSAPVATAAKLALLFAGVFALAGCGTVKGWFGGRSNGELKPAELTDFTATAKPERLWSASIGDGEMTWLQFGVSGADTPNALITYGNGEVGVSLGRGKFVVTTGIAPGEAPQCAGNTTVTGAAVAGHYTCPGVVSYDAGSGKMGKVDVEVRFTAKS